MKKIKGLLGILFVCILTCVSCGGVDKNVVTYDNTLDEYKLVEIEKGGVIYIDGYRSLAPYYSPNGKLCHYVNGQIVEIDN